MKRIIIALIIIFNLNSYAQKIDSLQIKKEKFLKEFSNKACECVDSIRVNSKSKKKIAEEIGSCIDKQVVVYQMGVKMFDLTNNALKNIDKNDKAVNVTLDVESNPDSNEYKKYFFELERSLMEDCQAIKDKINVENKVDESTPIKDEAIEYYNLGQKKFQNKEYEKALELFEKAVKVDDQFAFAWDNIGVCNRYLGNYDKAINAYEKSIKINPNGLMPLQNLAIVYSYKKEYENAIKTYEKLAKIDNQNPEVYYGIGQVCYQFTKDYEKSLQNMCKAYNLYVEQKSPYRTDAEKIISLLFKEFKSQGKEARFHEILKENHLSPED